jgi:hypothetical protein
MFVAAAVNKATIFLHLQSKCFSSSKQLFFFQLFFIFIYSNTSIVIVIDKSYSNTSILHLLSTISLQTLLLLHNYSQQQKANFLFISIITTSTSTITRREKIDFNGLKKKA